MNLISSLNNFYNNLSSDGVFFFWMLAFLFAFLIFLSIVLLIKNNKLTKIILKQNEYEKRMEEENKINIDAINIDENNKEKKDENLSSKDIHTLQVKEKVEEKEDKKPVIENNIQEEKVVKEKIEAKKLYQKNLLREINAKMPTSPISIEKKEKSDKESFMDMVGKEENSSPLLEMEDNYSPNKGMIYLEEVSKKLENEKSPSNIELTEFEKKQEEEAIISYNELLKVKDKIYNITEDEETDEFIDELKSLRLDLQ